MDSGALKHQVTKEEIDSIDLQAFIGNTHLYCQTRKFYHSMMIGSSTRRNNIYYFSLPPSAFPAMIVLGSNTIFENLMTTIKDAYSNMHELARYKIPEKNFLFYDHPCCIYLDLNKELFSFSRNGDNPIWYNSPNALNKIFKDFKSSNRYQILLQKNKIIKIHMNYADGWHAIIPLSEVEILQKKQLISSSDHIIDLID